MENILLLRRPNVANVLQEVLAIQPVRQLVLPVLLGRILRVPDQRSVNPVKRGLIIGNLANLSVLTALQVGSAGFPLVLALAVLVIHIRPRNRARASGVSKATITPSMSFVCPVLRAPLVPKMGGLLKKC